MNPAAELRRARKLASGIKGLAVKPLKSGALLWYWEPNAGERRAGWKPLKFQHDEGGAIAGAKARNAEVAAWRLGVPPAGRAAQNGTPPPAPATTEGTPTTIPPLIAPAARAHETIAQAVERYAREHLVHHSANHQKTARSNLKAACAIFGDERPADIQPHHIAAWTDAMRGRGAYTAQGRQVSDVTAHNRLRTFRALLNWIKNPHPKFAMPKGRDQLWEADDEAAFIAAAYDLGLPSMAFAMKLAIYTGQRSQDLIAFTEAQVQELKYLVDGTTRALLADAQGKVWGWAFTQKKEDVPLHIPFEPDMLQELRTIIARNRAIDRAAGRLLTHVLVNDRTGEPYKARHFIRAWNAVKDHAIDRTGRTSMDDLHWHDLRRTRVVRLKRQGFTHDRIAQLTGHQPASVDAIMQTYGPVDVNMTAKIIAESTQHTRAEGGK